MLLSMGLERMVDLYRHIPVSLHLQRDLALPSPSSEWELEKHMRMLANQNTDLYSVCSFLGAGMYEHHVPAVVDAIADRGEFLTAYTPYQPEMSQGLLQVLAEYQQYIGALTGLPVVNSSCYDGATALADAIWIGCQTQKVRNNTTVALSQALWPQSREVVNTYFTARNIATCHVGVNSETGLIDLQSLEENFAQNKPAVFAFQTPNCFGLLENIEAVVELCKRYHVISVLHYHPFLSGLFTPPGRLGVDIVCGEGQPLGIPLNGGGPSLGFLACSQDLRSYISGRLVGTVADIYGNPAYALVHEEREQHIAREKATSNICSNQAHCALRATVFLSTLGDRGLQEIALLNAANAHYLANALANIPGLSMAYDSAFFNEFVINLPCSAQPLLSELRKVGIYGGVDCTFLGNPNALLIAVTETKNMSQLDDAVAAFQQALTKVIH